jgi:apolipoprotein N-acyltransferase
VKMHLWPASKSGQAGLTVCALAYSGLAHALLSPPLSWVWLHPIVWLPALAVFSRLNGWRALSAGWLVGLVAHCTLFSWLLTTVETFSGLPLSALDIPPRVFSTSVLLLFGLTAGFATAVFALGVGPIRRAAGPWWPLAVAVWFVACEFLNPQLFPFFQRGKEGRC